MKLLRKFLWRTTLVVHTVGVYYLFVFIFGQLREGRYDPMAGVIGWTTLAIFVMGEVTAIGYVVLVRDWWTGRRADVR